MKELLVVQNRQHFIPPLKINHFCQTMALNQTITLFYLKTKKLSTTQKKYMYQKFLIIFFINVAKDIGDENINIDKRKVIQV
jgi:hypothetical protein